MLQAILFDFDGTLINTNDLVFQSYRYAFRTVLNREITMEEILNLYGRPLYPSLKQYEPLRDELYSAYKEFNLNPQNSDLVKKFPGVAEGIHLLNANGFRLGIVTSKRLSSVMSGLNFLGLENAFEIIITPADTQEHKPHPAPVLAACEKMKIIPNNVLMVGDSVFDLMAGKSAGCAVCAVTYSTTALEELKNLKPDYMIDTIEELANQLTEEKRCQDI